MPDEILIIIFEAVHGRSWKYRHKGHLREVEPHPRRKKVRTGQNFQPQILVEPKNL